jgi:GrpB-like predicted nucleotidyltransferase (UPF0157 family)
MIGLRKGSVELALHQESWQTYYLTTKQVILNVIGAYILDIQHIGSTSIVGILAKPIIDIGILIQDHSTLNTCIQKLVDIGYIYRGNAGDQGGHLLVKEIAPLVRTEHIHIIQQGDIQWDNYIKFRDFLNQHPDYRLIYSNLKETLALQFSDDRSSYTKAKADFILNILKMA